MIRKTVTAVLAALALSGCGHTVYTEAPSPSVTATPAAAPATFTAVSATDTLREVWLTATPGQRLSACQAWASNPGALDSETPEVRQAVDTFYARACSTL